MCASSSRLIARAAGRAILGIRGPGQFEVNALCAEVVARAGPDIVLVSALNHSACRKALVAPGAYVGSCLCRVSPRLVFAVLPGYMRTVIVGSG